MVSATSVEKSFFRCISGCLGHAGRANVTAFWRTGTQLDTHVVCPASPSDRAASCCGASLVKETTTRTHVSAHAAARIRASSGKHGGKDLKRTLRLVARSRRNVLSPTAQRASHRRSDDGKRRVHALMLLLLVVMSIFLSTGAIVYAACRSQRRRDRCMHRHNRFNSLSSRPPVQLPRRRAF